MTALSILNLGLRPAQLKALDKRARQRGKTAPQYIRWLIERDLLADKSFDELLMPIREDIREAGITEEDLDQIVDRARGPVRRKRRGAHR
jgi:hypothetical protein